MSKKKVDFKARMGASRKRQLRRTAVIAMSVGLVATPLSMNVSEGTSYKNVLSTNAVSAESLANVQVLSNMDISAILTGEANVGDFYDLALGMTGEGLAELELVGSNRVAKFAIPELAGKLNNNGMADVSVEIITMADTPEIGVLLNDVTEFATGLTTDFSDTDIPITADGGLLGDFVKVEGLSEVTDAVNNLNTLEDSATSLLTQMSQEDVLINSDGSAVIDFGDNLETSVNDRANELVQDLFTAIDGVEITILADAFDGFDNPPIIDGFIGGIIGPVGDELTEELLSNYLEVILGDIQHGLSNLENEMADLPADLTTELLAIAVIGEVTIDAPVRVDNPAGVDGEVPVYGAGVNDAAINLEALSDLEPGATIIFDEPEDGDEVADLDVPTINDAFEGETKVSGTGFSGATVEVRDDDGNVLGTAEVDDEGNFIVDLNRPLVASEELEVSQSKEDLEGVLHVSDPAIVIVQETGEGDGDTDGADGEDGTDGADGEDGTDGADGEDGTDGSDGEDGADGSDGEDGSDGADFDITEYGNGPPETKAGYKDPGKDIVEQDDSNDDRTLVFGKGEPGEGVMIQSGSVSSHIAVNETISRADYSDYDNTLPNTATSTFNWLLGGLMAMIAGTVGLFTRKRKKGNTKEIK